MKKYIMLLLLVAACKPIVNNAVSPIMDKRSGLANGEMRFNFESQMGYDSEIIDAHSSDGENFRGSVVKSVSTTTGYESVTNYYKENGKTKHSDEWQETNDTTYNPQAKAVLMATAWSVIS